MRIKHWFITAAIAVMALSALTGTAQARSAKPQTCPSATFYNAYVSGHLAANQAIVGWGGFYSPTYGNQITGCGLTGVKEVAYTALPGAVGPGTGTSPNSTPMVDDPYFVVVSDTQIYLSDTIGAAANGPVFVKLANNTWITTQSITVRGQVLQVNKAQATGSSVTAPSWSAPIASGNNLFIVLFRNGGAGATVTAPTGWTLWDDVDTAVTVLYRSATGTSADNPPTISLSASTGVSMISFSYTSDLLGVNGFDTYNSGSSLVGRGYGGHICKNCGDYPGQFGTFFWGGKSGVAWNNALCKDEGADPAPGTQAAFTEFGPNSGFNFTAGWIMSAGGIGSDGSGYSPGCEINASDGSTFKSRGMLYQWVLALP